MKKVNPKIILPIIALLIMVVQNSFGLKFDTVELQTINDAVLSILALIGIFANPTIDKKNDDDNA